MKSYLTHARDKKIRNGCISRDKILCNCALWVKDLPMSSDTKYYQMQPPITQDTSMGESNIVVSAYTLYRHLQQYCSHPST